MTIRTDTFGVQRNRFSSYFSRSVLERLSVVSCAWALKSGFEHLKNAIFIDCNIFSVFARLSMQRVCPSGEESFLFLFVEAVRITAMYLKIIDAVMRDFKDGTRVLKCIILLSCQNIFLSKKRTSLWINLLHVFVMWNFCWSMC